MQTALNTDLVEAPLALPWLIDLNLIGAEQQSLVGTKAWHLARMQQAGFAVPEAVCITTEAFRQGYLGASELTSSQFINGDACNNKQPRQLSPALKSALLASFATLQQRHPNSRFAVRSSALEEDTAGASWAGMFLTSLDIDSSDKLLRAVEQGFASLDSDPACLYRLQQPSSDCPQPAMALIIQRQIEASASGMVFTRNPLADPGHPDYDRLCINAVRGLGEALADGQVDGDHYWLDRQSRLLEHRLAAAQPGRSVQPPVLSRIQMRKLAQSARSLERRFEHPLDIEFAFQGQQLWLLQARAIVSSATALSRPAQHWLQQQQRRLALRLDLLQRQHELQCGPGILSNSNIAELLPSPTPMSFAIFKQIFAGPGGAIPMGRRALGYHTDPLSTAQLFELVAGQPYFHLEIDARSYEHAQPLPIHTYLSQIQADPQRGNYPEFGLYQQFHPEPEAKPEPESDAEAKTEQDSKRYRANRRFHRHMTQHGLNYLRQYRQWIDPYLEQQLHQQRAVDLDLLNAPQLIIQINHWLCHLRKISCCHFVMAARLGFYFAESLRFQLQPFFGDDTESWLSRLLQALPGSRITQQSFDLQALRQQQLDAQGYLQRYGHLASNELELSLPRYAEHPGLIDELLCTTANRDSDQQQPKQAFLNQQRQRKQDEREFSQALQGLALSAAQRQQLWSDLRLARRFLPLRETIKYHYTGEYALIRKALLKLAQRLGLDSGQIFYLQPEELPLCLKELPQLRKLIQQRQQQHLLTLEIARLRPMPAIIVGDRIDLDGHSRPLSTRPPAAPASHNKTYSFNKTRTHDNSGNGNKIAHQGRPMAPGFIRGKVRLIDAQQCNLHQLLASLDKNDILVTRSANLGLSPLMRKVAGLIVEVGGLLAHSACQAREAGIPAMVLPDATRLLREGSLITFNGRTGQLQQL